MFIKRELRWKRKASHKSQKILTKDLNYEQFTRENGKERIACYKLIKNKMENSVGKQNILICHTLD